MLFVGSSCATLVSVETQMKKCSKCNEPGEFYTRSSMCIECHKAYNKKWYKRNQEKHRLHSICNKQKWRSENRKLIKELKSQPCTDCNKSYPYYVMDFDHLRDKKYNIHQMVCSNSPQSLKEELSKCELVCSNCHRERTHQRKSGLIF